MVMEDSTNSISIHGYGRSFVDYFPEAESLNPKFLQLILDNPAQERITGGGMRSNFNWIYETKEFEPLLDWMLHSFKSKLDGVGITYDEDCLKIFQSWSVTYEINQGVIAHNHLPYAYSCIYYVNSPEGSAATCFKSYNGGSSDVRGLKVLGLEPPDRTPDVEIKPEAGKCIFFPSFLQHYVLGEINKVSERSSIQVNLGYFNWFYPRVSKQSTPNSSSPDISRSSFYYEGAQFLSTFQNIEKPNLEGEVMDMTDKQINTDLAPEKYYFYSTSCNVCKYVTPKIDELISNGHNILKLDIYNQDNMSLVMEIQNHFDVECGTPFLIDVNTGSYICGGMSQKNELLKQWIDGEFLEVMSQPNGQPPPIPLMDASEEEIQNFKEMFAEWKSHNQHLPSKVLPDADLLLDTPRLKYRPPQIICKNNKCNIAEWSLQIGQFLRDNSHLEDIEISVNIEYGKKIE